MPITCLLVDDHTLFREGIRRLLESHPGFQILGEASNAERAVALASEFQPDVVLMDIGMPGLSSFEAARLILAETPHTHILFLTMYEDEELLQQGLEAGAGAYLLKDVPAPELIHAVQEVAAGRRYVSPTPLANAQDRADANSVSGSPRSSALTRREREVVKLIAEGNSVRQIAGQLGLSIKTIEAHKFNLMRKLNIHNKAQLVTYAIQKRIVQVTA